MKQSRRRQTKKPGASTSTTSGHSGERVRPLAVAVLLLALSLLLQSLIFAPGAVWPVAFVCLVPWLLFVCLARSATTVYLGSYALGLGFFLVNVRWMAVCTPEGWLALSAYLAVYFPLVACPLRHAVRRRDVPLAMVTPVVWVASELCRAVVISGFPWFLLGHSQYRVLSMIQISDLVGAYGVSFVLAAVNGAVADVIIHRWTQNRSGVLARSPKRTRIGVGLTAALLLLTLVYGQIQLRRDTTQPGPKIAVLQQDYPNFVDPQIASRQPGPYERSESYAPLFAEAAAQQPDLFLLPETPWHMALNPELRELDPEDPKLRPFLRSLIRVSRYSYDLLQEQVHRYGAYVVTGGLALVPTPHSVRAADIKHNSAYILSPDGSPLQRYDKVHCVYFGEVVPFRYGRLRFLYLWLNARMPFSDSSDPDYEYSLTPGNTFEVFEMTPSSQPNRTYRFGVPICYEDVMPYVSRRFVTDPDTGRKRVDFLLNISNDGWFVHSNELPQHMAICVFRAVENRVGIARAVNTGISGFIDANGRIERMVEVNGVAHGPGIRGVAVGPIAVDSRQSLYSRIGDVFAILCAALGVLAYLDYVIARARGTVSSLP